MPFPTWQCVNMLEDGVTPGAVTQTFPTCVVGSTVTLAVIEVPVQPFAVGVIVKVTVWEVLVELDKLPEMSPIPFVAIPVTLVVLSLTQLKVVPATS